MPAPAPAQIPPAQAQQLDDRVPSHPGVAARALLATFVVIPLLAALAALPLAIGWGWVSWLDIGMLVVTYAIGVLGITVGYHRLFTHRSFKTSRTVRVVLAVAGSLAVEGRLVDWVADHRRHHKFSDAPGDPHSPWEYGGGAWGLTRGLWHAHVGWLFTSEGTDVSHWAPDLRADRDLDRVSRWWPALAVASLAAPAILGGLLTWSWMGLLQGFFWGSLVRVALVHHVTWSVNSVCHVFGRRPFVTRDRSSNVAWLAVLSGGESWHNYHHADPTSARHGVLDGQVDVSASLIRGMERLGWAHDVRWPSTERVASRRVATSDR